MALFYAHSGLRYLVLLAGVVTVAYHLIAWARSSPFSGRSRLPVTVFVGLLDLQIVLGIVLLITRPFLPAVIGHLTMMLMAAAFAHGASIANKRKPEAERRHTIALSGTLLALVFVIGGILALGRAIV